MEEIVRQLAAERTESGSFPVTVRFWEDILEDLQGHEALLRKHYERWWAAGTAGPRISTSRLPVTGETFVAREAELARLDAAWGDGTNVFSFVATGGAGKSALINRWLAEMQNDGWRGADRVLGWSFYSQGTESAGASSEAFTEYALDWLGYTGDVITSPWKKGEVLARLVRERRTLLILDGLESLQHPPGSQTGKIKDPAVQALVREMAADNPGLCVITTRLEVADLAGRAGADSVDLEKLPPEAGAELLRRLEVKGKENELRAASEERGGHGLALTLLGTYLRDICGGDIRRRNEVAVLNETAGIEGSDHARHVMEAYEAWFGSGPELQILHLLGLFDRPAEPEALKALRAAPEIPGLTEGISSNDETAWHAALSRLRYARLVAPTEEQAIVPPCNRTVVDTHPLVREHFGERVRENSPEAWRAAHERLYDHYRQSAPDLPDTLDEMLPLYAAVVHGCRAGREQEAYSETYARRITRGNEYFSTQKLGAFGAEITALAAFFEHPWDHASVRLTESDRMLLLIIVGYILRAVGRLPEAVQPLRASEEAAIVQRDWKNAAIAASNLSELTLTLGDVPGAVAAARKSVDLADRSGFTFQQLARWTNLADALHQAGRWTESANLFRQAEAKQAGEDPQHPYLYSLRGYQYCDLLLSQAEPEDGSSLEGAEELYRKACHEVRERAAQTLEWAIPQGWLLDMALDHLSLSRSLVGLAWEPSFRSSDLVAVAETLDHTVETLRGTGEEEFIARGLLTRAVLRRLIDDFEGVATDLREAQEIAERGSMRLHEADTHLEWTRLHLATGDSAAAREHLDRARDLVHTCGYGRREREVTWLEGRLAALEEGETA